MKRIKKSRAESQELDTIQEKQMNDVRTVTWAIQESFQQVY